MDRWMGSRLPAPVGAAPPFLVVIRHGYLTGEELSLNAHRPTQLKKRPSHNQYPNPADLLPPSFSPSLSASPATGLLPDLDLPSTPSQYHLFGAYQSESCFVIGKGLNEYAAAANAPGELYEVPGPHRWNEKKWTKQRKSWRNKGLRVKVTHEAKKNSKGFQIPFIDLLCNQH